MTLSFFLCLSFIALWISYQDVIYGRIPNLALIALSLLIPWHMALKEGSHIFFLQAGLIGTVIAGLFLLFSKYRSSVGIGDLKLFCIASFFMTLQTLPVFMIASGTLGLMWGLIYKRIYHKKTFPLGPVLIWALVGVLGYQFWELNLKSIKFQ